MRIPFHTCDVFTDTRFGGNPLAVVPEASGLDPSQMQAIAREFNYSETTFVLPGERGHTRRVRIFTPTVEVPFAGHPNVGTAFVLASCGALGALPTHAQVEFEEGAGIVPVSIESADGRVLRCEVEAPQTLDIGRPVDAGVVARALSLSPEDVRTEVHAPLLASVGLSMLFVEMKDLEALGRARPDPAHLGALVSAAGHDFVHVYTRTTGNGEVDIRARMFAPSAGVPEDPATGSANCTLGGLLAHFDPVPDGAFHYRVAQGVEMGRPSRLEARAEKREGEVQRTWIGGACVAVSEGSLLL